MPDPTPTSSPPSSSSPPPARRVLVTGGSGLIGSHLARDLGRRGYEVVVLSRSPEKAELPAGVRAVAWDAESPEGWGEHADGAFAIVHLAGENVADGRWTEEKKRRIRDSRVRSTRAVRQAIEAAARPPRVLVQGSAVGYYGTPGAELVTEDSPPGDDFLARVAVEWEEASEGVEERGVRRPVVRTGVVLAEEGGALPKMALPYKLFVGGRLGGGRQYVPWIHLDDEVAAIRFLMEHDEADGPFNLTAPHPVENRDLSSALARVLGRPDLFPVPKLAVRALMGEAADMVLGGQRALPRRLEELGFAFRFPTLEGALEDLLG